MNENEVEDLAKVLQAHFSVIAADSINPKFWRSTARSMILHGYRKQSPAQPCEHDFNYHTLKKPCSNCNAIPQPPQECEICHSKEHETLKCPMATVYRTPQQEQQRLVALDEKEVLKIIKEVVDTDNWRDEDLVFAICSRFSTSVTNIESITSVVEESLLRALHYCGDGAKWLNQKEKDIIRNYVSNAICDKFGSPAVKVPSVEAIEKIVENFRDVEWIMINDPNDNDQKINERLQRCVTAIHHLMRNQNG